MVDFSVTNNYPISGISTSPKQQNCEPRISLEQKPDEVILSGKKPLSTNMGNLLKNSILDGLISPIKISPEELETAQNSFKQLFMRDDITIEDTKTMIREYKEANKIKDPAEYANAIYKLAKKNYGFDNIDLPLVIIKAKSIGNNKKIYGGIPKTLDYVMVDPTINRIALLGNIHHELRHAKQYYYSACMDKEKYAKTILKSLAKRLEAKGLIPKGSSKNYSPTQNSINNAIKALESRWGTLSPDKIPEEYKEWTATMLDAIDSYVSPADNLTSYTEHIHETDAKYAGNTIQVILNSVKNKIV